MEEHTPPHDEDTARSSSPATSSSSTSSTEPMGSESTQQEPHRKASTPGGRRLDPLTFIGGLVFVALALVGLTDRIQLSATDLRWLGPVLLVGFGILLVVSATGSRTRHDASSTTAD